MLFDEYTLGSQRLKNRMVMAPMTHCRAQQSGDIPTQLMAQYYQQRAGAGLIVTEAAQISSQGKGYSFTPGIYTQAQIEGWKQITDAVHHRGGKIILQLWHVGRMSHASLHSDGLTVAPSAFAPGASVWIANRDGGGSMKECPVPRALSALEIEEIIKDYTKAAANALAVGFDGIEIHAGNGYLLDQFMRSTSNIRTDRYGGSIKNRIRIVLEIMASVSTVFDASQVGIRLSPHNTARGMDCPEMIQATYQLVSSLQSMGIGYLHFAEADWDNAPEVPTEFRREIRRRFDRTIIVAGKYTQDRAEAILREGYANLVAFGRLFISNPDLPVRMERGYKLTDFDDTTLFGGGARGYTDYAFCDEKL